MRSLPPPPGYEGISKQMASGEASRVQVDVVTADRNLIKSIAPEHQVISRCLQHFIHSIANELRSRGITHYDTESEQHLADIVLRRTSPYSPEAVVDVEQTDGKNEPRRTKRIRKGIAKNPIIKRGVEESTGRGSGGVDGNGSITEAIGKSE